MQFSWSQLKIPVYAIITPSSPPEIHFANQFPDQNYPLVNANRLFPNTLLNQQIWFIRDIVLLICKNSQTSIVGLLDTGFN